MLAHRRTVRPELGGSPFCRARRLQDRQGGYATMLFALLLIPLLLFSALAVDVGSFYVEAAQIQRAADAGALAGVVWMPADPAGATKAAKDAAARNGMVDGQNGVTISVVAVVGADTDLDVIITDATVPTYFGGVARKNISITRSARGRYVLPIPLGSPLNTFGNQTAPPTAPVAGDPQFWGSINAPYTSQQYGDPYATKCLVNSGNSACASTNPDYRSAGYRYAIDVPVANQTLTVSVLDGFYFNRGTNTETGDVQIENAATPPISYQLFAKDNTPLDPSDNPVACAPQISGSTATGTITAKNIWTVVCTVANAQVGQYVLQVKTNTVSGQTDQGSALTQYALKATMTGTTQPSLYGIGDMSIFTNAAAAANLFLAKVGPQHAGKTFRIELFDPGDGNDALTYTLSIMQPTGVVAQCSYSNYSTDVMGSIGNCDIVTHASSVNRYNGKWLIINVKLANTYTCDASLPTATTPVGTTSCWWKIKYNFGGGTPYDRTTWKARIIGDPVTLVK